MKRINIGFLLSLFALLVISCSSDNDSDSPGDSGSTLKINLSGVEPLSGDLVYEGWIVVNGESISVGRFNTSSSISEETFSVASADLNSATSFVLSIEEANDQNSTPSNTKILKGDFATDTATLSFENAVGFVIDSSINYNLHCNTITPTDGTTNPLGSDENYGIWFQNSLGPGLFNIPVLNEGWKYEGWVVFNGNTPLSTGKFTSYDGADESSIYSGSFPGNNYPGEDFLNNLPSGVSGYVVGSPVVISIEPDLSSDLDSPFFIKPISGVAVGGLQGTSLDITDNFNATITGTAVRTE